MDSTKFNEKYKNYLADRHYGLAISNPEVISYLDELFETRLTKIIGFEYFQIKMKYGYSRCYLNLKDERKTEIEIEKKINEILRN